MLFNHLALNKDYIFQMYKIRRRMKTGLMGNLAKMNYLKILWEDEVPKLQFSYAQKNKKKEHSEIIRLLTAIDRDVRDSFLTRYLARCKLTNALAFFQWRCMTLVDTEFEYMIDLNRKVFDDRIKSLINNIE